MPIPIVKAKKADQEKQPEAEQESWGDRGRRTLFFGKCPEEIKDKDIYNHYYELGDADGNRGTPIETIKWQKDNGKRRGYGFVVFKTVELRHKALEMPPPKVGGRRLVVNDYFHKSEHVDSEAAGEARHLLCQMLERRLAGNVVKAHKAASAGTNIPPVEWDDAKLKAIPVRKGFPHRLHSKATPEASQRFRAEHAIQIEGLEEVPGPVCTFEEVDFPKEVQSVLTERYDAPSPIQSQAWPLLLHGHDVIGLSETGSGKTLAFLLPGIVHLRAQPRTKTKEGPVVLVLAPTRELALQIATEAQHFTSLRVGTVYGGGSSEERVQQAAKVLSPVDIVVSCPGRLVDFLEAEVLTLQRVSYLVIDEADHSLRLGYRPQIEAICTRTRPDRQTLMFSATWTENVQQLAQGYLRTPVRLAVDHVDELRFNKSVKQDFFFYETTDQKVFRLLKLLDKARKTHEVSRALVFVDSKEFGDYLCDALLPDIPHVMGIHSEYSQDHRERALRAFRDNPHGVLVASDVASRGLDIKDLAMVVNYNVPNSIRTYIHRIGRTGRAGKEGLAYTFISEDDAGFAHSIVELMKTSGIEPPKLLARFAKVQETLLQEKRQAKKQALAERRKARREERLKEWHDFQENKPEGEGAAEDQAKAPRKPKTRRGTKGGKRWQEKKKRRQGQNDEKFMDFMSNLEKKTEDKKRKWEEALKDGTALSKVQAFLTTVKKQKTSPDP